ncbi:hypothetical protein M0Q50_04045 [bacterium]|jgi:hypothetical protein|nr:hypothetical protein [bacterium]
MENLRDYKEFKGGKKGSSLMTDKKVIKESFIPKGDIYDGNVSIELPKSLIKAYTKKIKDESGKTATDFFAETTIAEKIVDYVIATYLNVENLPSSILFGDYMNAQVQPVQNIQPQAQAQVQTQVQEPEGENVQADATAAQIPAQETTQPQGQVQQTQPQGQVQQPQGGNQEI